MHCHKTYNESNLGDIVIKNITENDNKNINKKIVRKLD